MSVDGVINTIASQDATDSMGASTVGNGMPSGSDGGKPVVGGIDDVFNLYSNSSDESAADKNGVELKESEKNIPDELNNVEEKKVDDVVKEEKTEEKVEEKKVEEKPAEETQKQLFKVKVDGQELDVELKDLLSSYSGQQAIQKRFTEFDKAKKQFESEKTELVNFNNYAKQEIGDLRSSMEGIVSEFQKTGTVEKNPLEAVNNLLDKMGINSNLYTRALFEHQLPEFAKFFNMTDIEREAYFTKQENDYLRRKERGFIERDQQVKLREESQRKDFELIRSAGLDTVQYESLRGELSDAGMESVTAKDVVTYAQQKPILQRVVDIASEAKMDFSNPKLGQVKELLLKFPETTNDEILDRLIPDRAALNASKVLQQKQPKSVKVVQPSEDDDELTEQLNFYRR